MRLRLVFNFNDQMFQNVVLDFHDTVDFLDDFRFSFKGNENVVAISLFFTGYAR